MKPKVSIVVPIYNVEKYVEKCLESLVNQTLTDIEIILINDGSTDKSGDIVRNIVKEDRRIIYIEQDNKGLSKSRNVGIDIARGEYIAFVDSDDWVELDMFEKLYIAIKREYCDLAICSYYISEDNKQDIIRSHPIQANFILQNIEIQDQIKHNLINGSLTSTCWDKLYRLDLLKKYNIYFEDIHRFEDIYFYMNLCKYLTKVIYIDDNLYHYRVVNNSLSKKKYNNYIDMIISLHKTKLEYMDEWKMTNNIDLENSAKSFLEDLIIAIENTLDGNSNIFLKHKKFNESMHNELVKYYLDKKYISLYINTTHRNKLYTKPILFFIKNRLSILLILYVKLYKFIKK